MAAKTDRRVLVSLVVAFAYFMYLLDSTIVATAAPQSPVAAVEQDAPHKPWSATGPGGVPAHFYSTVREFGLKPDPDPAPLPAQFFTDQSGADLAAPPLSHIVSTPIGRLLLTGDGYALTGLYMIDADRHASRPGTGFTSSPSAFAEVAAQLEAYFDGDLKEFTVPLAPSGTPFQLAVWTELTKIPYGSTVSYGDIARALGKRPVASRAVGLANGSNPISVIVPCHRVIGSDGSLTGYGGGLERKEQLLRLEGAGAATLW